MTRISKYEPLLALDDIQGDILIGLPKRFERLLFFKIVDAAKFGAAIAAMTFTSAADCLAFQGIIADRKRDGIETLIPTPGFNIAFTFNGLAALHVNGLEAAIPATSAFREGMAARQATLLDPPLADWTILRNPTEIHGVFIVTGASDAQTANIVAQNLAPAQSQGWTLLHEEDGVVRPNPVKGHEHFGFADGVSQPGVRGLIAEKIPLTPSVGVDADQGTSGQDLLWPGEFVFGYSGQDGDAKKFTTEGPVKTPPIPFMEHGAYLVFRKLAQLVPEFNLGIKAAAATAQAGKEMPSHELLAAQVVGRWKSGAAIINAPHADDPSLGDGTPLVNAFEFGGDRTGVLCPWAAHILKAYPRDDVFHDIDPDEAHADKAEAFTQTHRMLRRGIAYGPELSEAEALAGKSDPTKERGLMFLCYVTSIENQFEFVQQNWVDTGDFSQVDSGIDPIIGQTKQRPFLGAAPISQDSSNKPMFTGFLPWVTMQGGAYLFAPSLSQMKLLNKPKALDADTLKPLLIEV